MWTNYDWYTQYAYMHLHVQYHRYIGQTHISIQLQRRALINLHGHMQSIVRNNEMTMLLNEDGNIWNNCYIYMHGYHIILHQYIKVLDSESTWNQLNIHYSSGLYVWIGVPATIYTHNNRDKLIRGINRYSKETTTTILNTYFDKFSRMSPRRNSTCSR